MDINGESGLRLREAKEVHGGRPWTGLAAALLLYGAVWGAALDMLQMGDYRAVPIAGAAVIALIWIFAKTSRTRLIVFSAFLLTSAVCFIIWHTEIADGLMLIANRMFELSEANGEYEYDRFAVSAETGGYSVCIRAAFALLTALTALLFAFAGAKRPGVFTLCVVALFVFAAAYFGVYPAFIWILALAACVGFILLDTGTAKENASRRAGLGNCAVTLILLAAVGGAVLLFAPGQNGEISALENHMRDELAYRTVYYSESAVQEEDKAETDAEQSGQNSEQENTPAEGTVFNWPEIPSIVPLVLLILLILFVPSVIADRFRKRVDRNRAGLEDKDCGTAIRAMFPYSLRWLFAAGVAPMNAGCLAYRPQLRELMPESYCRAYSEAAYIWREAAFSEHEMTEEQRGVVHSYMEQTKKEVLERVNWKDRLRIKYRYKL